MSENRERYRRQKFARDEGNISARMRTSAGPMKKKEKQRWAQNWRDGVLLAEEDEVNPAEILDEEDEAELSKWIKNS